MSVAGEQENANETLIPGLPNDVAEICIAKVPFFSFQSDLSLVCKPWRRFTRSQSLLRHRECLNIRQNHLFLATRHRRTNNVSYSLVQFPPQSQSDGELRAHRKWKRVIAPSQLHKHHPVGAACVAVDEKVYMMGGSMDDVPTSKVWVFNALSGAWSSAPDMSVAREFAAAGVIRGKIYVVGGCLPTSYNNWAEFFDPLSQTWNAIPSPPEMRDKLMHGNVVLQGKLLAMADRGGVTYDPSNGSWSSVSTRLDNGWKGRVAVVDEILYSYDYVQKIRGYNPRVNKWFGLQGGVQSCLPKFLSDATLVNVGEKLYVVWASESVNGKQTKLMCAALDVWNDSLGSLHSRIHWLQDILYLSYKASIVQCLSLCF